MVNRIRNEKSRENINRIVQMAQKDTGAEKQGYKDKNPSQPFVFPENQRN